MSQPSTPSKGRGLGSPPDPLPGLTSMPHPRIIVWRMWAALALAAREHEWGLHRSGVV